MASGKRFYLMKFRNRDCVWGDIGSLLTIQGLVVGGNGAQAVLMLPEESLCECPEVRNLSVDEWSDFIQRSDNPEILIGDSKVFHRKVRYAISGSIQQRVWVADNFECKYCKAKMGTRMLTIDHFMPLELGGANDESNYITACRSCNMDKGSEHPADFCKRKRKDYQAFVEYLKNRKI